MSALRPLENTHGILFDSIVDKKFSFGTEEGDRKNNWTPYTHPWVGILHNPPSAPPWFGNQRSAQCIISSDCWKQSIEMCRGLFTLSEYLARWLRPRVPVTVCSLFHPTETLVDRFSFLEYQANRNKSVLHIGWWLRKVHSFYRLDSPFHKVLLHSGGSWFQTVLEQELKFVTDHQRSTVTVMPYLSAPEYDSLLARNVAFLDFYDTSANNAVVECMARQTPLVVNRHPALEEYLGADYPLFFEDLEGAAELLRSEDHIRQAHLHLQGPALQARLCNTRFRTSLRESAIYRSIWL